MNNDQNMGQNAQAYIKTITIIHLALVVGQVLFAVFAFAITGKTTIDLKNINDPFIIVVPIMAIGCFIAGNLVFKKQVASIAGNALLSEKLATYQSALIIRFALLEGASLFGIVVYFTTGNLLFLIIAAAIILYFITLRPTKDKIEEALDLSYEEKIIFERVD